MKNSLRIGEAAKILGVTVQTLRNWGKSGKLQACRSVGGHRYYDLNDLQRFKFKLETLGWAWASSEQSPELPPEYYCERPDRFTSRVNKMGHVLLRSASDKRLENIFSLLTLVVSEIGDNSFAHNVGSWPDVPGIFFAYDIRKQVIVLADRGRGVRATLERVRPDISNDMEALKVAFTEVISGRYPEKRGNGLKVVREIAESQQIGLLFQSGLGRVHIPQSDGPMRISLAEQNVRGVYAVIKF